MKIDDVIKHLTELKTKYGDVRVKRIELAEEEDEGWIVRVPAEKRRRGGR